MTVRELLDLYKYLCVTNKLSVDLLYEQQS